MPRLLVALLVASLVGNAALLLVLTRHSATSSALVAGAARASNTASQPIARNASSPGATLSPEAAAILNGKDPTQLNALLLAAGVDSEIRTQLVQSVLWKNYEPRLRALDPSMDEAAAIATWWKDPGGAYRYDSPEGRSRHAAYSRLNLEMAAELKRITGVDPEAFEPEKSSWLARQYGGLPREKAEALYRIGRDYDELQNEIQSEVGSFELPADREKRRLLDAERERDIAALLTPEERLAWDLRSSETANRLRSRMTQLDATEDEYRRIYVLQKAFDTEFESPALFEDSAHQAPDFWPRRQAAQAALEAQIRAVIGDERYTAAALENDHDYTSARAAAERLGLPVDTAPRLIALREPAAVESRRIAADPKLGLEEKKAALARLAAQTRAEVTQTLGPAAETYFKRGAMTWLDRLENGHAITLAPDGGYESISLDSSDRSTQLAPRTDPPFIVE